MERIRGSRRSCGRDQETPTSSEFSIALPHSEFLDQGHIETVCTRVQFASHECPARVDLRARHGQEPSLRFLRSRDPSICASSSHLLPDLVVALKGPPTMPIEVNAVGRIDSVRRRYPHDVRNGPGCPDTRNRRQLPGRQEGPDRQLGQTSASQVNRVTASSPLRMARGLYCTRPCGSAAPRTRREIPAPTGGAEAPAAARAESARTRIRADAEGAF